MAFLGNLQGPKESDIVEKLGPEYFGIDWKRLENDIELYRESERRREVIPLHVDDEGEPYIILSSPDKEGQRFYLRKAGYRINGSIKTYTEDEQKKWQDKAI